MCSALCNCNVRVLWHVGTLTPCSTTSAALRTHWRFQLSHSWLQFVTWSRAVHWLFVCSRSLPLRWYWLEPLPCLLSSLAFLSATSFAACLNCGFFAFRFYGFLCCNRPGFFSGLVLLNCLLLLVFLCCCSSSDFLTVCTLSFISAAFCSSVAFLAIFCVRVTSHRCDSLDSVSARTCSSNSSHRRHLVHHVRVLVLVEVLSISSVLFSVRVSDFVLFCSLWSLACGLVIFFISPTLWAPLPCC